MPVTQKETLQVSQVPRNIQTGRGLWTYAGKGQKGKEEMMSLPTSFQGVQVSPHPSLAQ